MNLYYKYAPLLYTYNTRIFNLTGLIGYIYSNLGLGFLVFCYLFISGEISLYSAFIQIITYSFIFISYILFYEIGYVFNDLISIKKEKNPTKRIFEKITKKGIHKLITIRLILGLCALGVLLVLNLSLFINFIILLFGLLLIFSLHNRVRNLNINFFTLHLLRSSKFLLFIIIIYQTPISDYLRTQITLGVTIGFLLFRMYDNIFIYNEKNKGINKLSNINIYLYISILQPVLYIITSYDIFLVIFGYYLFTFLHIYKKGHFNFKSNR